MKSSVSKFQDEFYKLNIVNREVIVKLINTLFYLQQRKFTFCTENLTVTVPIHEIMYFEKEYRVLILKTIKKNYRIWKTLQSIEEEMPKCFVLVNRQTYVNIFFIAKVHNDVIVMEDRKEFYLTRGKRDEFYSRYNAFMKGKVTI